MSNTTTLSKSTVSDQKDLISEFNIFKILGKDDKELIHSAFIQFLLKNDYGFCQYFGIDHIPIKEVRLEKSYTLESHINGKKKKRVRRRIDIEALDKYKKPVLVIENKFKSFPYEQQLKDYEKIYEKKYSSSDPVKVLFCFDKDLITFKTNWHVFDYKELNDLIKQILKKEKDSEKQMFLRHYSTFLTDYYKEYNNYSQDFRNLLEQPTEAKNKFWLRLMFSAVRIKLEKDFQPPKFRFLVNPGNTSVPLINIIPAHWTFGDFEFLIQFQGNDLKFYVHILNTKQERTEAKKKEQKIFIEKIIHLTHVNLVNNETYSGMGKLKKLGEMHYRSYYLYKENIISGLKTSEKITIEFLVKRVFDFYKEIEKSVIPLIRQNQRN